MAIFPQLFGMADPGATFSAIAQMGPIIAIIFYFRSDIGRYIRGILRTGTPANIRPNDLDARLGWFTLLGSLPGMVFGALLEKKIEHEFRSLYVIAASLIIFAIVLLMAERVGSRRKSLDEMTFGQSQVVGWAQVLSLVPGASRSGVTISAGLLEGLDRESAARFSFLLSLPFISAAGLYKLYKALRPARGVAGAIAAVPSLLPARDRRDRRFSRRWWQEIFAYVVVTWFLGYMREHNTGIFIVYRIALGIFLLALLSSHKLQANQPKPEDAPATPAATTRLSPQVDIRLFVNR